MVIKGLLGFRDDFEEHILHGRCKGLMSQPVPCVYQCPAHVDIPGYVSLVHEGRYADAVNLIRKDNPLLRYADLSASIRARQDAAAHWLMTLST